MNNYLEKNVNDLQQELTELRKALVDQAETNNISVAKAAADVINRNINQYKQEQRFEAEREISRNKVRLEYYRSRHAEQTELHGQSCSRTWDHLTYLESINND